MGQSLLIALLVTMVIGLAIALALRIRATGPFRVSMDAGIERIQEIGELSVLRVMTKEIVTATDHDWGEIGSRYLRFIMTEKRMAMVFAFEIDCRYDLRSADFRVERDAAGAVTVRMPSCTCAVRLADVQFYDEQNGKLLPWLLPGLVNEFFSRGFDSQAKNQLKNAARAEAEARARSVVRDLRGPIEQSARDTLSAVLRGAGARVVSFDFGRGSVVELASDTTAA